MNIIKKPDIDVSIVIVNYNGNDLLDNFLKTFYQFAEGFSYQIIVVDNSTIELADAVVHKYPEVELIRNTNDRSFSAGNNIGFNNAKGKYVLIINNDMIFVENTIRKALDYIESKNGDLLVGCKILNVDMSRQESVFEFDNIWNEFTENFFLYKIFPKSRYFNKYYLNHIEVNNETEVDVVKGCFMLAPLATIKMLNGFDERFKFYSEETDLCYRLKQGNGKVYYYPGTSIIHLGGATTDKYQEFKFRNQSIAKVQFYQKHYKGIKRFLTITLHYTGVSMRIIVYILMGAVTFDTKLFVKSYYYFKQLFVYPKNVFKIS